MQEAKTKTMKASVITPTHNVRWLGETWQSLKAQTHQNFEWVVCANGEGLGMLDSIRGLVGSDPRVRILVDERPHKGIGQRKQFAFLRGTGDFLIELDHDDLLLPNALEQLAGAFESPEIGFVYSDSADFEGASGQGLPSTYMTDRRPSWEANGFAFYARELGAPRPGRYTCVRAFLPSAAALSLVYWAPNHVRAWRRTVYEALGGHNPDFELADDHELLIRTYLETRMRHIPEPLYLYRVSGENTWAKDVPKIRELTYILRRQYLEKLVLRECTLRALSAYDLGGALNPREGWIPVDKSFSEAERSRNVHADLEKPWPWETDSVGAFRAVDFLEHLPDKLHTMRELHRCLAPGGWLLSATPSTDGRGAWQDPTHVSFWNQNSMWYLTRAEQAKYIGTPVRFQEMTLTTEFPSSWHREHNIPYVYADLIALKGDYHGPGERYI